MKGEYCKYYPEFESKAEEKGNLILRSSKDMRVSNAYNINIARGNIINTDYRLLELAPSKELFNWYINLKNTNNLYEGWFEDYRKVYLNQLKNNKKALNQLKHIKDKLDNGINVAIYCFCKDVNKCHRNIIGNLFEKKGYKVFR